MRAFDTVSDVSNTPVKLYASAGLRSGNRNTAESVSPRAAAAASTSERDALLIVDRGCSSKGAALFTASTVINRDNRRSCTNAVMHRTD